jgi:hypothetical protein
MDDKPLTADDKALVALRRSRAVAAVSELQRRSVEQGTDALASAEIDAEIAAARRDRRRITSP